MTTARAPPTIRPALAGPCPKGNQLTSRQTPDAVLDRAFTATVTDPDFSGLLDRVERIGGCENPVHLVGHTLTIDAATGDVVHVFSSDTQPHGRLMIACGNRRASRCGPCSWLHQGDTYQLVVSGLTGGKGVPETVREHPRVFVTLTAPGFGAVHRVGDDKRPCRPNRRGTCPHGVPRGCDVTHASDDRAAGTPLCPRCYDYAGAVLFNACAGELWNRFTINLRRAIASTVGKPRSWLGDHLRVSYAKVAEYQRRGAVHFHAVIRLDGPAGPDEEPPTWATTGLLMDAVREAHSSSWLGTPESETVGMWRLRFGPQMEVRPVLAFGGGDELTERAVASYIAKYVTKGDVPGLVADSPIRHASAIGLLPISEHARTLMRTCWRLGGLPEFERLNLRMWTHQLGFRGHVASKSRVYSTTYRRLRSDRADFRRSDDGGVVDGVETFTDSDWRFIGQGYTEVEAMFAAEIAAEKAIIRENSADARISGAVDWG